VKLGSVVSNLVGKTGRAILGAISGGTSQPERLAELACGSLRFRKQELAAALKATYTAHFRWLLGRLLQELDWLDGRLAELDGRISEAMLPHEDAIRRLCTIPGVDRITAWVLIAELGVDMTQFPSAKHAASWAGLSPGNNESGGKRFSGKTRKGNRYLRRILVQNAWAVAHKKDCFLTGLFYRVASRRGMKKAAMAVAHRVLIIAYCILRDGSEYRESGSDYFDRLHPERTAARLTRRLERIGFDVVLTRRPEDAAAATTTPVRRRGRPCLCAARGIPCTHDGSAVANAEGKAPPPARTKRPRASAVKGHCSRCDAWGIPCIHVRNQKFEPDFPASPADSRT